MKRALLLLPAVLLFAEPAHAWRALSQCGSNYTHWAGTSVWQTTRSGGSAYYSGLSDNAVQNAISQGFQVWSDASCCSSFAHQYGGDTSAGYTSYDNTNAIEFYEGSWPAWLGSVNSTIAVTLPQYSSPPPVLRANSASLTTSRSVVNGVTRRTQPEAGSKPELPYS